MENFLTDLNRNIYYIDDENILNIINIHPYFKTLEYQSIYSLEDKYKNIYLCKNDDMKLIYIIVFKKDTRLWHKSDIEIKLLKKIIINMNFEMFDPLLFHIHTHFINYEIDLWNEINDWLNDIKLYNFKYKLYMFVK